ncbi:MAG: YjbQ family protein [Candidatus Aminicenantes bacterium]|nr:YjbQ family protein [Candidatus Aminicenantes bacterium]
MIKLSLPTARQEEFLDITSRLQSVVRESRVRQGLAVVFCPHTTCALTINEHADPDVRADILMALRKMAPDTLPYAHAEGNSPAHVKASLLNQSLTLIIEGGEIQLGTWQGIFLCEFDGPRTRQLWIKVVAGDRD